MKRTIMTVTLLSLLLAASTAFAQTDITLAHVWTTVQGMQSDFIILARELRLVKDRLDDVESSLGELTTEPILIDGQRCLIQMKNRPHAETLSKYVDTYGTEPYLIDFLTLQSIYYDTQTNEIILHFREHHSDADRHVYEFWDKCEFSRSSDWQEDNND